jgi:hypothetical protein
MPKRLVKKGVTVVRDGQRIRPEVNKGFDFTADEIERITEVDPAALGTAAEAKDAENGEAETASTTSSAEQSQAKAKGGKKKATAGKSDAENAADGDGNAPDPDAEAVEGAGTDDDL